MTICEFCGLFTSESTCKLGLRLPKKMSCREFDPIFEKFCSNPTDFVDAAQIKEMSIYFGLKGPELKKIDVMVVREKAARELAVKEIAGE
jgi:hypothetical protein